VLISRAAQPALALLEDEVFEVEIPQLEAADPRGAGDSMTAGVAAVLAQDGDLPAAVRTGAAAGALNVTRHGLGTGRPDAIAGMVERVNLKEVGNGRQRRTTPDELATRVRTR
jgi:1-phosphofructokinase